MFNVVSPLSVHVVWMSRSGMKTTFLQSKYKFGSLEPVKGMAMLNAHNTLPQQLYLDIDQAHT